MHSGTTTRRLLPELVLVLVTAAIVALLLTRVGGKKAADTESVAWHSGQESSCAAAAPELAEAGRQARENSAAVARINGVPDAALVNTLVAGAGRMAEKIRAFSIEFRSHKVPAQGINLEQVDQVAFSANALATIWDSLGADYADLETQPGSATTQRIADWTLRADDAAKQLSAALSALELRTCTPLAQSMSPQA